MPDRDADLPTVSPEVYEIESELAHGGLGRVVRAVDRRMNRVVALKEVLPGRGGSDERFVREALITGRLEHPGIVPVHEAGRWPTGEPFYAMKLVSGEPLAALCQRARTLGERLALLPHVLAVAEAIAYAHSKHVIHRDIKPSNVIVGRFGETVVIDWGLAKELGSDEPAPAAPSQSSRDPLATEHGAVMGTPAYMSPEQAMGQTADERTDVYALGAMLYHVLTGEAPFASSAKGGRGPEDDTGRGHSLLVDIATKPAIPLEQQVSGVPPELAAVVRKAMAMRPEDRYADGQELAAELRRFLDGQLVQSHIYSPWELARRWARRHRLPLIVAGGALAALLAVGGLALARVIEAQRLAERRADELLLTQARSLLASDTTTAIAWLKQLPMKSGGWAEARAIAEDARSRGIARRVTVPHEPSAYDVTYSPDGRWLASVGSGKDIVLEERASGRVTPLAGHERAPVAVNFTRDGKLVSAGDDGTVRLWTLGGEPSQRVLYRHDDKASTLAVSADGRVVASGGHDKRVHVYALDTREEHTFTAPWVVHAVALSPDGAQVVYHNEAVFLVDVASGAQRELGTSESPRGLAWSNDGRWLALGDGRAIRLYDARDPRKETSVAIPVSNGNVEALAFAPDGSLLVASTWDGHVYVWDTASHTGQHLVAGDRILTSVAIAPDAAEVAAVGLDGTLWLWPTPRSSSKLLARFEPGAIYFAIDDAARRIAYGARDRRFHLDDLAGGAPRVLAEDLAVHKVAFVPGADALVALQSDKSVERWDLATGAREKLTDTGDGINEYLRVSRDGSLLASVHTASSVWLYDLRERKLRCRWPGNKLRHFALAPDGKQLYWASGEAVKVGDTTSCAERTLYVGDRDLAQLAVSPDGTRLAWSRLDGVVGQHDLASGKLVTAKAHRYDSGPLAYSPDGTHLASGGDDNLVVLWRADGLVVEHLLRGHEAEVRAVRFSPDGKRLVSFAYDGTLREWDVATGEGRVYRGHNGTVVEGFFAGDQRFVSSATDGNIRLWTFDDAGALPHAPEALRAWMDEATTTRLVDGRALSP